MKKIKKIITIVIIIVICSTATFFIGRQIGLNTDTSSTKTTVEEQTVGTQTIKKTLSATGEISTTKTEKSSLSTTKYFKTMCVETDDIVKKGKNILQYTDGTYLKAPYDCVISEYSVPTTKTQATSSNYVQVQNIKNIQITLSINENEISSLKVGQEVEIVLTADDSKTYTGKISSIDSVGTYSSSGSTFNVIVKFTNDGDVKLGMSASCTITIEELKDVVAVPIAAVQTDGDTKYVDVIQNGSTKKVEVETGLSNDEYVQITSGLSGGEIIKITTVTKESTIRSTSSSSSKKGNFSPGNMEMPSFSGMSGSMGEKPSMPGNK